MWTYLLLGKFSTIKKLLNLPKKIKIKIKFKIEFLFNKWNFNFFLLYKKS